MLSAPTRPGIHHLLAVLGPLAIASAALAHATLERAAARADAGPEAARCPVEGCGSRPDPAGRPPLEGSAAMVRATAGSAPSLPLGRRSGDRGLDDRAPGTGPGPRDEPADGAGWSDGSPLPAGRLARGPGSGCPTGAPERRATPVERPAGAVPPEPAAGSARLAPAAATR